VTGGTGLLGNCIVRELRHRGFPVRVLCRKNTPTLPFDGLDVEIVHGDLEDRELIDRAVAGTQATIHSAAYIHIGWENLEKSRQVNVGGTETIAKACVRHHSRLIHISTVDTLPAAVDISNPICEADGDQPEERRGVDKTPCSYVLSKREAEAVVQRLEQGSDLDAVTIHPGFMLGPFDWKPSSGRMMLEVSKVPLVVAPPGGCSVCDARDVAGGVVMAMEQATAGQHYILAGQNLSYQQLWQQMLDVIGSRKHVFRMGPLAKHFGPVIDLFIKLFPIHEGDVNGASLRMGYLNHFYCSSKAQRDLDYRCRPLEQTLEDAWDWLSKHHRS
jgi:dihydroflavonol-4-reductase